MLLVALMSVLFTRTRTSRNVLSRGHGLYLASSVDHAKFVRVAPKTHFYTHRHFRGQPMMLMTQMEPPLHTRNSAGEKSKVELARASHKSTCPLVRDYNL